jgi:hypothetical protein
LPRELPTPSDYPGKEGACEHEWKYLNFDKDDSTDQKRLEKLHHTICSGEMRALTSYGSGAAERLLAPYKRFFPLTDEVENYDDLQDNVVEVLELIMGTSSSDGAIGSIVESFVVDNLGMSQPKNTCLPLYRRQSRWPLSTDYNDKYPKAANKEVCSTEGTEAYTSFDDGVGNIEADGLEKIHFCPIAWDRPQFDAIVADCEGNTDAYPSEKMDTFSRIALHEMTHMSTVGPPIIADPEDDDDDGQIKDVSLYDDEGAFAAYGPINAHALADPEQGDYYNPDLTQTNADNYAWMALDALVSRHCASDPSGDMWQGFFTESPPRIDSVDE